MRKFDRGFELSSALQVEVNKMLAGKYLYKVELDTTADITEFVKIASRLPGKVTLISGGMRINAKSVLGVLYAKMAWNDIYVESESDCWWELRKFMD